MFFSRALSNNFYLTFTCTEMKIGSSSWARQHCSNNKPTEMTTIICCGLLNKETEIRKTCSVGAKLNAMIHVINCFSEKRVEKIKIRLKTNNLLQTQPSPCKKSLHYNEKSLDY